MSEIEIEYSKRKGNLLITGPHGSGKSTIINIILKDGKYDIVNLNMLDPKIKAVPTIDVMRASCAHAHKQTLTT